MTYRLLALTAVVPLALGLTAPATASPAEPARSSSSLQVTGYAEGGLSASMLAANRAGLTTVTIDGVSLTDGGRSLPSPSASMLAGAHRARAAGLRTELLMSNYSNALGDFDPAAAHTLLASQANRQRIAYQLAHAVRRGGWDGVNVDLELVPRGDAAGLVAFVRTLQQAMPAARTVSIDVSASTSQAGYRAGGYDLRALGRTVDLVQLMAYDQHGPTWSGPGPVGDLRWQTAAARTALRSVPAARLDLGQAGYGYTWPTKASGRTGHTVSDRKARTLVQHDGATAVWHQDSGEWSATLSDGTRLWWADARSYRMRLALARQLGVHGLAVWRLGSADPLPRP